jgi:hypothetical protein
MEPNISFSSLNLDKTQLQSLLQSYNLSTATIDKVLADPSLKVGDIIPGFEAGNFQLRLDQAKGGTLDGITAQSFTPLEALFLSLIEIQAKQSELEQLLGKTALANNETVKNTQIEANRLAAKAERWNAIAQMAGGAVSIGFSAASFKASTSERSQALSSIGSAGSGMITGITSIFTAGTAQAGKNLAAEADYISKNSDSIRSIISAIQKLSESAQNSGSSITSLIASAARN